MASSYHRLAIRRCHSSTTALDLLQHSLERFGPVREVVHDPDQGLVLEVAFEGLARSTRHKSGLAMRFPRINRLRWDKPPGEADRLETLERMLKQIERGRNGAPDNESPTVIG